MGMNLIWMVITWVVLAVVGIGAHFLYTRMVPDQFTDRLMGFKTKVFGAIVAISPDLLHVLNAVQMFSDAWTPSDITTTFLRVIGVMIVVLRTISDYEGRER